MLKLNDDNDSNDTVRNDNDRRKKTISMIPIALKPIIAITIIEK